jgi:hypothetical protein
MPHSPPRQWRPEHDEPTVRWEDIRPHEPRENPEYAMYRAVLDAIAEVLGTEES